MEETLLRGFDRLIARKAYTNRSEAIRDFVRQELAQEGWKESREVTAVLTLVYDHHQPGLLGRLSHLEHEGSALILSNQHVHLDHFHCLEVLTLHGRPVAVQSLSDRLRSLKGVKLGTFNVVTSRK